MGERKSRGVQSAISTLNANKFYRLDLQSCNCLLYLDFFNEKCSQMWSIFSASGFAELALSILLISLILAQKMCTSRNKRP